MAEGPPANRRLSIADRALYHQIHPAKLGTDLLAELVSVRLLWRGRLRAGLAVHFLLPIVASAIVTRRSADLVRLRDSAMGRYISREMTPAMQAVRLAGDAAIAIGAWRRSFALIAAGGAIVIAGWTVGPKEMGRRARGPWGIRKCG